MALNIPILSSLDTKGFDKAAREFAKLDTASAKTGYALKKAFLPAVAALGALGFAAVGAAKMASDLNEETSKSAVIFGDASTSVMDFSKTAATALGQSQTQALKAAGTFGVLGKAAGLTGTDLSGMAIQFTKLASDLASFNNTSPEDAVLALGAGLRGEAEPLRRYGILLNDATLRQKALELGLVKTTKDALSPQNKSLAAQAVILEQTSMQQGDFARTADGAANKQRILTAQINDAKTNIGKGFLPVMALAVGLLADFAGIAKDNAPLITGISIAIGGLAAAVALANGAMIIYKAGAVITTAVNAGLASSFFAVQIATGIGIATAVAGVAALAVLAVKVKNTISNAAKTQSAAMSQSTSSVRAFEESQKSAIPVTNNLTAATEKSGVAQTKTAAAASRAKAAAKALAEELAKLKDALRDQMTAALDSANKVLDEAISKFDAFAKSVSDSIKSSFSFGNAQQTAAENVKAVADASDDVAKAQKAVAKAIADSDPEGLTKAYEDLAIANKKLSDAQASPKSFLDNLKIQANKVKDFGVLVNSLLAAGLSESALQQVLAAGVDSGSLIAKELLSSAGNILEANALTAEVQSIADTVGLNSAKQFYQAGVTAGTNLVAGIQAVVDNYTITLNAANTAGAVAGLTSGFTGASNAVMGGGPAPYDFSGLNFSGLDFSGIDFGNFVIGGLATLAEGGIVTGPTLAMIGEGKGPEAVIPLDRLGDFGGGGNTININVNGGDPQAVVDALRRYNRSNGPLPVTVQ
jgi:hypothetical protein